MAAEQAERFETVIVGGGQAGLSTGYHLARRGRTFVILDARARIGVAPVDPRRRTSGLADFVLSPFGKDERAELVAQLPRFTSAVETWLTDGIDRAMSLYNREPSE